MYLPNEMIDFILAYGFRWCMTTCRFVSKEWKEKIDQMVSGMFTAINQKSPSLRLAYNSIWKSPTFDFHLPRALEENILLSHIRFEINKVITKNGGIRRFTNLQCVNVYGHIFTVCSQYGLTKRIYDLIPSLFHYSFSQKHINLEYLRRFYRIIFSYMSYHTTYYKLKTVNEIMEEHIELME